MAIPVEVEHPMLQLLWLRTTERGLGAEYTNPLFPLIFWHLRYKADLFSVQQLVPRFSNRGTMDSPDLYVHISSYVHTVIFEQGIH